MNRNRSLIVALLLLLFTSVAAHADEADEYIEAEMKKRHIPGLALAVVKNGQVIKAKSYGLANLELDVPVTLDSVFELASVTKPFTATAIMLLVEEGKVGLDDKISKFLINAPYTWRDITVRHLLTHTAGFASDCKEIRKQGWLANYMTAEMFEAGSKCPADFAPGERWQYSDLGYFLLGMIIEEVSGKRYREFVRERIFQPLGMTATTVIDQWEIIKNRAAGYTLRDGKLAHIRRISQIELPSHYGI
ncbi:MAG: serine hydrolase domain-containing protein, partial [Terriglobia bacterium]